MDKIGGTYFLVGILTILGTRTANRPIRMPWSNMLSTWSLLCGYLVLNNVAHQAPVFQLLSNMVIFYIFYFVASCLYIQQQEVGILIKLFIGITVIASFLMLLMLFGNERGRILTWFCENRTDVAMAILCVFPFILGYSGIGLKSRVVLGVFFLITLIFIDSRTSYIALLISGCIFYFPYIKAYFIQRKNKWIFILGIWMLLILLCWGLYSYRSDSVLGRFQIWRITCAMIRDAPIWGHGGSMSFEANYMLYQAAYFRSHPDSPFAILADNVKAPFNEYLWMAAQWGLVSLIFVYIIAWQVLRFKTMDPLRRSALASLGGIMVASLASYPLHYGFTGLIIGLNFSILVTDYDILSIKSLTKVKRFMWQGIGGAILFWGGTKVFLDRLINEQWHRQTVSWDILEHLSGYYRTNAKFLYGYAVKLRQIGDVKSSNLVLVDALNYINNYDVQLMLGENYMEQGLYHEALSAFQLANNMCPNRFYPLYYSFEIYKIIDPIQARKAAEQLVRKTIKVDSYDVRRMKIKAQMYLITN